MIATHHARGEQVWRDWLANLDTVFRRNHEGDSTPWDYLDASLHHAGVYSKSGQ